jgi:ABC-2 type transport system permease protein
VLLLELVQSAVIVLTGIALGWSPSGGLIAAVGLVLLGTIAFAGIGLLLAGTLRAEANLAVANGLFLVLLFLGGMAYPLARLPDALETFARLLPAAALSETLRGVLDAHASFDVGELVVLVAWAVAAPLAAVRWFRWDD